MSDIQLLDSRELAQIARNTYAGDPDTKTRLLQGLRPYICPFHDIIPAIAPSARVLDVGCGAGLFLLLLAQLGRLDRGLGFDVSGAAIRAGARAAKRVGAMDRLAFEHRSIEAGFPPGDWNVVSVIDVIHHVPRAAQPAFIASLCDAVQPGGRLVIKDMVTRPRWRAAANIFHDLVMAGQWAQHAAPETIEALAEQRGFKTVRRSRINTLWYGHWSLVMERH
jgi:2-polyprenyl-3-methyl-5-hydroxy-6-metoxy-1,4-benzoquinol methylase